jgi:hypothetical protein
MLCFALKGASKITRYGKGKKSETFREPCVLINIRVSSTERMLIRDAARASGLSVAEFCANY